MELHDLNPINFRIMHHPVNWLIVVVVAVIGALYLHHIKTLGTMVSAGAKHRASNGNRPANVGTARDTTAMDDNSYMVA
jgi:hypothetical protein